MKKINFNHVISALSLATLSLIADPAKSFAADIQWNGFGSGYYGQAFTKDYLLNGYKNTKVDFTDFSLMGLNVLGKVTDDISFAGQILAQGANTFTTNSFNLSAQWAFLSYRPTDSVQIKVGRQLYPVFIASEYVSVGYLQPYQSIPTVAYALSPFNSIDGISVGKTLDTPVGSLKSEVFGGSPVFTIPTVNRTFSNLLGASFTLTGDDYLVHLAVTTNFNEGAGGTGPSSYSFSMHSQHYSLGYKFEKYGFVSWTEFVLLNSPDSNSIPPQPFGPLGPTPGGKVLGFGQGAYSLIGYRIGKFMPRYTYSEGNFLAGFINGADTIHTFGLNYQFKPQIIMKAEYNLDIVPDGRRSYTAVQANNNPPSSGSSFLAGIDFIF